MRRRHAVDAGEEVEVLVDGEIVVERELLRHVPDLAPHARRAQAAALAGQLDESRARLDEAAQHLDRRRLAGAVGAEEAVDLTVAHREVHALRRPRSRRRLSGDRARRWPPTAPSPPTPPGKSGTRRSPSRSRRMETKVFSSVGVAARIAVQIEMGAPPARLAPPRSPAGASRTITSRRSPKRCASTISGRPASAAWARRRSAARTSRRCEAEALTSSAGVPVR